MSQDIQFSFPVNYNCAQLPEYDDLGDCESAGMPEVGTDRHPEETPDACRHTSDRILEGADDLHCTSMGTPIHDNGGLVRGGDEQRNECPRTMEQVHQPDGGNNRRRKRVEEGKDDDLVPNIFSILPLLKKSDYGRWIYHHIRFFRNEGEVDDAIRARMENAWHGPDHVGFFGVSSCRGRVGSLCQETKLHAHFVHDCKYRCYCAFVRGALRLERFDRQEDGDRLLRLLSYVFVSPTKQWNCVGLGRRRSELRAFRGDRAETAGVELIGRKKGVELEMSLGHRFHKCSLDGGATSYEQGETAWEEQAVEETGRLPTVLGLKKWPGIRSLILQACRETIGVTITSLPGTARFNETMTYTPKSGEGRTTTGKDYWFSLSANVKKENWDRAKEQLSYEHHQLTWDDRIDAILRPETVLLMPGHLTNYYWDPETSYRITCRWFNDQCDEDLDTVVFRTHFTIEWMKMQTGKRNTMCLFSPPSCGKNYIFDALMIINGGVEFVGNIPSCVNRYSSNFTWQDCVNKTMLLWNEPSFADDKEEELLAILGGDPTKVAVKYKDEIPLTRTPVLILSNPGTAINKFIERTRLRDRMSIWELHAVPWLKLVGSNRRLHPKGLAKFFKQYGSDYEMWVNHLDRYKDYLPEALEEIDESD